MNLKISENCFRFRITPEELDALLCGDDVDQRVFIAQHCFSYRISPFSQGRDMTLEMAVAGFCLSVPRECLEELRHLGRSKRGICITQNGVEVWLQVDIKEQMKKAV